ncbi:hypothetical protein KOI35_32575 [Actinoplanes bogorensis]|uniref:Uncharacterized protein n=1 Tax=Paractinoplanes bogorensis TaxID=1610840 RepID=A0ABS5YXZ6_9ACTN|nr:hypothetical protein [Actinoplanes bogorensis]MBU2668258.1 hypothetical protein [Actinoplanes bogorensis]
MDSALVLGAGGITGIAWHLGVIIGPRSEVVDLTTAGLIVGSRLAWLDIDRTRWKLNLYECFRPIVSTGMRGSLT